MNRSRRMLLAAGLLAAALALTADANASVTVKQRTLTVTGTSKADKLTLRTRGRFVVAGKKKVARRRINHIVVRARGGDDLVRLRGRLRRVTISGGTGADRLALTGEALRLSPDGVRVRIGAVVASLVEQVDIAAGALTVDDLAGTTVQAITADADGVVVNGTQFDDTIDVSDAAVTGLAAPLTLTGARELRVNALAGFDRVSSTATALAVTADGGPDDDALVGGPAAETLLGGDGVDAVDGNGGDDRALLGAGDDRFTWDAGDGSDVVEGEDGMDTLAFNGSGAAEALAAAANGPRVRFTRDVGSIAMDLGGVERIDAAAVGGGDSLTVGDASGTDLTALRFATGTDGAGDTVKVDGSAAADAVTITGAAGQSNLAGLPNGLMVAVTGAQAPTDRLTVNGRDGDDTIDAGALAADAVRLTVDGGAGADTLRGGRGPDVVIGGDGEDVVDANQGDDTVFLGAASDAALWNPGDGSDIIEGQEGNDFMSFEGAPGNEEFELAANGGRVRFTRNIANVLMDLDDVESIQTAALGGTDRFTVTGDLGATDLDGVAVNLGAADGAADDVAVTGSSDDDLALLGGDNGTADLTGLAGISVIVSAAETPADRLSLALGAGDDRLDATGLEADAIRLRADGENGDDQLLGGRGPDMLRGGNGDDVLIGGPGNDDLDGGAGNNTVID